MGEVLRALSGKPSESIICSMELILVAGSEYPKT